ncbi:hypothetical protein SCHPADRAFT_313911 [Schizopora paradoxa]|uniref:Uncharacterized protein n=1 Tax=Schizopora paradoxa TaxID=27342 RepID=A0A0H2RYE1_9AGAM|nr:hypothetical protein SCHPADRAFT_313911 [Schizopora paradoxa]
MEAQSSLTDPQDAQTRRRNDAAVKVQRAWRMHNSSLMNPKARWNDALLHAKLRSERNAAEQGKNDPSSRWRRGVLLAGRLRENSSISDGEAAIDPETVKILEMQHWLELTDRCVSVALQKKHASQTLWLS